MANQEFKGIKKAVQQRIEGLKNFKQEPVLFISEQLISELAYITSETQREVCVYITRSGEIIFSSIGERDRVSLENMSMRRSEQRLSGFRCIHTHPGGSDMLSEVDIQSLKSLRLDAMAAIGVKDGRAGYISAAVLESIEGELRPKFMRSPSWNLPHEQWMQAIMEADRAIVKSRVYQTAPQKERVMLLGHGDLAELEALTLTAGGEICARVVQKNKPLGEGKLKQAALEAQAARAQLIIYDGELSPSRQHELEERFSLPVIDRIALILDIFAMRARSGEGQLQVELAQCKYALSRLTGQGIQLSRQGGGIGTRGPGEKKLESDRRHLKRREAELEKQLEQLSSRRSLMRRKRKRSGMPLISLIGYTNAGKSTLLNALTGADAFCEDKLFATLDPLTRTCELPDGSSALITDPVGFVRRLPHLLIEAFKSTLEEASQSELLLHVCDASEPELEEHIKACERVLEEIGAAEIPRIMVLNKADKAQTLPIYKNSISVSALNGEGINALKAEILKRLKCNSEQFTLDVPYPRGDIISLIHRLAGQSSIEYLPEHARIRFAASREDADIITAALNQPD